MAKPVEYNATLVERIDITSKLAIFKIRSDEPYEGEEPRFVPGQYVTLGMNNEEKPELGSVRRPMSIASAPEEPDTLEFYIRYVSYPDSDNPLTHLMWPIKEGDRMHMRTKSVGHFTLPHTVGDEDSRLMVFVAAGTGLAPFVSMVRSHHLRDSTADLSRYVMLHGASYPADLGYVEEMKSYQDLGMHYMTTVSRPKEAPEWQGDTGRVEDYFRAEKLLELEERLGLSKGGLTPDKAVIFICGLQGTIGKTLERLIPRGFVPDNRKLRSSLEIPAEVKPTIFFEQYDTTPVIDLKNKELMNSLRDDLHKALANS